MATDVGWSVRVPVVSLLFSDSLIAVTFNATSDPAGITTRPDRSLMSLAIIAVTVSPTLFLCERISAVVVALRLVPAARLVVVATGAAGAGVDAVVPDVPEAVERLGCVGVRAAGAGALAVGRSFSSALVSTGASCRSRLRLSAAAVSSRSPGAQAASAAIMSAAINVLDMQTLLM